MSRKDAAIEHLHELLALANERSQGLSDQLQQVRAGAFRPFQSRVIREFSGRFSSA